MHRNVKFIYSMLLVCFLTPVWAHSGLEHVMGIETGLLHPWSGFDHLIVMFAVGVYASGLNGIRAIGLSSVILAFMVTGASAVYLGAVVPGIDLGILLSLLVTGALLISSKQPPVFLLFPSMAGFAFCHGYAHAIEITEGAHVADYLIGFLSGTALIIGLGFSVSRICSQRGVHLRLLTGLVNMTVGVLAFVN